MYWWPLGDLDEFLCELIEHLLVLGEPGRCLCSLVGKWAMSRRRMNRLRCLVGELDRPDWHERALRLDECRIGLYWRSFILSLSRLNKLNLLRIEI